MFSVALGRTWSPRLPGRDGGPVMILPKVRDSRFVTIRRGGTLTNSNHHLLALWAASCADHVLDLFESAQPQDPRPRLAIEHARAWVRGEVNTMQARAAGGHAMARPEICAGPHGMPRTLLARPGPLRTSPRTNSVLLPMRSKPHVLPRLRVTVRPQGDLSAGGNVTNSRRQSVSSYLMTSGCGTTSVGQYLTAELSERRNANTARAPIERSPRADSTVQQRRSEYL